MIKVRVKAPWMDGKGLHKIGDIAEVETAAFDPLRMEEIRSKAAVKRRSETRDCSCRTRAGRRS